MWLTHFRIQMFFLFGSFFLIFIIFGYFRICVGRKKNIDTSEIFLTFVLFFQFYLPNMLVSTILSLQFIQIIRSCSVKNHKDMKFSDAHKISYQRNLHWTSPNFISLFFFSLLFSWNIFLCYFLFYLNLALLFLPARIAM